MEIHKDVININQISEEESEESRSTEEYHRGDVININLQNITKCLMPLQNRQFNVHFQRNG